MSDKSRHGDWYLTDDRDGSKIWASDSFREWTGLRVAEPDPRHPQDRVRGRIDRQKVPFSRPVPDPTYLTANEVTVGSL